MDKTYRVFAEGSLIGDRIYPAFSFRQRARGLLGKARLQRGGGMWLRPGGSVHTFGMRFPIDIVFIDGRLRVLGVRKNVQPNSACVASRGTRSTLELSAGACDQHSVRPGQHLTFVAGRDV